MKIPYKKTVRRNLESQIRNITHYDEPNEQDPMARAKQIQLRNKECFKDWKEKRN